MDKISWWNVDLGQEAEKAVALAVHNRCLSMGKLVEQFEERIAEMLQVPHVVAVTNGTSALALALLEAGVGAGDEVIVPNRTWIATAHAAHLLGAKPVFVDVEPHRPIIDVASVEALITNRTKVILPVHLNGCNCNMPELRSIAERHGITIIEDAAQALFSVSGEGGFLGTHSRSGCYSLSVAKLLTTGQGGFIVTSQADVARRLRLMRTHGTDDVVLAKWRCAGGNFRFTDILAAIALTQLNYVQERIHRVTELYNRYSSLLKNFKNMQLLPVNVNAGEIPLYVEVLTPQREALHAWLAEKNIQTRPTYPSLHLAPQFGDAHNAVFPNSNIFAAQVLTLPCGPSQPSENIDYVFSALQQWEDMVNSNGTTCYK